MLTKAQIKFVTSLRDKKTRKETGLFVAEGVKVVEELLASALVVREVFLTDQCAAQFTQISNLKNYSFKVTRIAPSELARISNLETPNGILAVVEIPGEPLTPTLSHQGRGSFSVLSSADNFPLPSGGGQGEGKKTAPIYLALDGIADPGNLGTIIRTAEWFGVQQIFCSLQTTDAWAPKVVQAAMGSLFRLPVSYVDLVTTLPKTALPIYAATLDGVAPALGNFRSPGVLVIGSESHGISPEVLKLATQKITIPKFSPSPRPSPLVGEGASIDSLNAAIATAVLLAQLRN